MEIFFFCSFSKDDIKEAKYLALDEQVFGSAQSSEEIWPEPEAGVVQEHDAKHLLAQESCIAYEECLKKLALTHMPPKCSKCSTLYVLESHQIGTALYITWVSRIL